MCLYCLLAHPVLGLIGEFDGLYCVFLHYRPGLMKRYPIDAGIEIIFTDDCFCFLAFHSCHLLCFTFRFGMQEIQPQNGMRRFK